MFLEFFFFCMSVHSFFTNIYGNCSLVRSCLLSEPGAALDLISSIDAFLPIVSMKYNPATAKMHKEPRTGATSRHNERTMIGGLLNR